MKTIITILRIFIVLFGIAGLLAGFNSLIFPGVGILIMTVGFVLALWLMTIRLTSPENIEAINKKLIQALLLAACGLLLAQLVTRFGENI